MRRGSKSLEEIQENETVSDGLHWRRSGQCGIISSAGLDFKALRKRGALDEHMMDQPDVDDGDAVEKS
jgi:hypothetical protein